MHGPTVRPRWFERQLPLGTRTGVVNSRPNARRLLINGSRWEFGGVPSNRDEPSPRGTSSVAQSTSG
jgi:hypothetical protein